MNDIFRLIRRSGIPLVTVALALLYSRGTVYYETLYRLLDIKRGLNQPATNSILMQSSGLMLFVMIALIVGGLASMASDVRIDGQKLFAVWLVLMALLSASSSAGYLILLSCVIFGFCGFLLGILNHRNDNSAVPLTLAGCAFTFIISGGVDARIEMSSAKVVPVVINLVEGEPISSNLVATTSSGVVIDKDFRTYIPNERIASISYGKAE